jgi:hypothetical protein
MKDLSAWTGAGMITANLPRGTRSTDDADATDRQIGKLSTSPAPAAKVAGLIGNTG